MNATDTFQDQTVGQLVAERPSRARIFERFGIDYCCGGKKPLAQACGEKAADLQEVLACLTEAEESTPDQTDWTTATLTALADHIEQTHHAWLKTELPRLDKMTEKVASVHGGRHPELQQIRDVFVALKQEMDEHLAKEEQVFFPAIRRLEAEGGSAPAWFRGPISVLTHEHDNAGQALARLRELSNGYKPPADACNTFRAMFDTLRQLEADMHQHVHKENNILFPRAASR